MLYLPHLEKTMQKSFYFATSFWHLDEDLMAFLYLTQIWLKLAYYVVFTE